MLNTPSLPPPHKNKNKKKNPPCPDQRQPLLSEEVFSPQLVTHTKEKVIQFTIYSFIFLKLLVNCVAPSKK